MKKMIIKKNGEVPKTCCFCMFVDSDYEILECTNSESGYKIVEDDNTCGKWQINKEVKKDIEDGLWDL